MFIEFLFNIGEVKQILTKLIKLDGLNQAEYNLQYCCGMLQHWHASYCISNGMYQHWHASTMACTAMTCTNAPHWHVPVLIKYAGDQSAHYR